MTPYLHSSCNSAVQMRRRFILAGLCVALLIGICMPHLAHAQYLAALTTNERYHSCSVTTSPNGKTIFKFTANVIPAHFILSIQNRRLSTWGLGIFFYDRNGEQKTAPGGVQVTMNQVASADVYGYIFHPKLTVYSGPITNLLVPAYGLSWHNIAGTIAEFQISVNSADIAEWVGITASMSIRSTMSDIWMDTMGAYVTESDTGNDTCRKVSPEIKPPPPAKKLLTVTVPDWDFGELKANDANQDIPLSEAFCLTYDPASIYSERLLLSVSNQNGTTGQSPDMFKLVHRDDANAVIPYAMRLRGPSLAGGVYRMPNNGPTTFVTRNFSQTGQTCINATYTTRTTTTSKPGDYMDTVTITVSNPT